MKKKIFIIFTFVFVFLFACGRQSLQNTVNLQGTYNYLNGTSIQMDLNKLMNSKDSSTDSPLNSESLMKIQNELDLISMKSYTKVFENLNKVKDFNTWIDYSTDTKKPYRNYKKLIHQKNNFEFTNYQHGLNNIYMPEEFDFLKINENSIYASNYEVNRVTKEAKHYGFNYYNKTKDNFFCISSYKEENLLNSDTHFDSDLYFFEKSYHGKSENFFGIKLNHTNEAITLEYFILGNQEKGYLEVELREKKSKQYDLNYYLNQELIYKMNSNESHNLYVNPKVFKEFSKQELTKTKYSVQNSFSTNDASLTLEKKSLKKEEEIVFNKIAFTDFEILRNNDRFEYSHSSETNAFKLKEKKIENQNPMLYFEENMKDSALTETENFENNCESLGLTLLSDFLDISSIFDIRSNFLKETGLVVETIDSIFGTKEMKNLNEKYQFIFNYFLDKQIINEQFVSEIHNLKNFKHLADYSLDNTEIIEKIIRPKIEYFDDSFVFKFNLENLSQLSETMNQKYFLKFDLYSFKTNKDYNFYNSDLFSTSLKGDFSCVFKIDSLQNTLFEKGFTEGNYLIKIKLVNEKNHNLLSQQIILDDFIEFSDKENYNLVNSTYSGYQEFAFVNDYNPYFKDKFYLKITNK